MICSFFAVALYSFENGRKITHFFTNRQIFFNFSFHRNGNADQIYFPQTDIQPCFKFDYCYLLAKFALKSNFLYIFRLFPVVWKFPNYHYKKSQNIEKHHKGVPFDKDNYMFSTRN